MFRRNQQESPSSQRITAAVTGEPTPTQRRATERAEREAAKTRAHIAEIDRIQAAIGR